jgi:hypothetical protein
VNTEPDPNPYVAPATDPSPIGEVATDAERVRCEHITHELSIRTIGALFLLGATLSVLVIVGFLFGSTIAPLDALLYAVMGVAGLVLGLGLRRLDPRVRIPSAVFCGFGLMWGPIGTVINAYFIYLLLCAKGRTVFTEGYQLVIEQTPHVRHRTSVFLWVVFFILVLVLLGVVISATLGL